jgi:predicted aconitase
MCFQGKNPKEEIAVTAGMIRDAETRLWTGKGTVADLVALGCPHFSFMEFQELARLIAGKRVHASVTFWVFTSRTVYGWIKECGLLRELSESGVTVFTDGCALQYRGG